eukprot:scaffold3.g6564.t1
MDRYRSRSGSGVESMYSGREQYGHYQGRSQSHYGELSPSFHSASSYDGAAGGGDSGLSREYNRQITQAASLDDVRPPPEAWPPDRMAALGQVLSSLNTMLLGQLEGVQGQNLGISLWSMSKLARVPQHGAEELLAALQLEVTRRLATVSPETYMSDRRFKFGAQGLANVLWSLGKMGTRLTFEVSRLVDVVCGEMLAQLGSGRHRSMFAPQNISNALHGMYLPSPQLMSELVRAADAMLRQFGPQEITNLGLLDHVADELSLLFADRQFRARVKPQTLSNLAHSYAALRRCPQKLMQVLCREALPLLPQFKPQELSNLLWALATMGHYPGDTTVARISEAAVACAERMKAQEVANTCWAWATLRFFPGAAALEAMLAACWHGGVERFKSQDIGNALWALLVFDILTPEWFQLLIDKMSGGPVGDQMTTEAYLQLFQAKMTLSRRAWGACPAAMRGGAGAAVTAVLPPEWLARAEAEWRAQNMQNKTSRTHKEVSEVLSQLGQAHELERKVEDGLFSVDIALADRMVAIEVDGSSHFTINEPYAPLGKSVMRWRALAERGWKVVTVPYFRWTLLPTRDARREYLWGLLQCENVWECLALDPDNRDAALLPPANLAHLTHQEVFEMAEACIPPTSLLRGAALPKYSAAATPSPVASLAALPSTGAGGGLLRPPSAGTSGSLGSLVGSPAMTAPQPQGSSLAPLGSGAEHLPESLFGPEPPTTMANSGQQFTQHQLHQPPVPAQQRPAGVPSPSFYPGGAPAPAPRPARASVGSPGLSATARPFSFEHAGGSGVPPPRRRSDDAGGPLPASSTSSAGTRSGPVSPAFGSMLGPATSKLERFAAVGSYHSSPAAPTLSPADRRAGVASSPAVALEGDSDEESIGDLRSFFSVLGIGRGTQQALEADQPQGQGLVSVEELVRRVTALPADKPAGAQAEAWMAGWEAEPQRFPALLRALASPLLANRAIQLYEWVRGLDVQHPLAPLSAPAASAAMLSLFGTWKKPARVARLFAQLKAAGEDGAEVYRALVPALCACDQGAVAVDTFSHMVEQGHAPDAASALAVIQLARGDWEGVDATLAELSAAMMAAATAVNADGTGSDDDAAAALMDGAADVFCAAMEHAERCGDASAAQAAFERMCESGMAPTPVAWGALLSCMLPARGREEVAEAAVELLEGVAAGASPGARDAALQALVVACRQRGWPELALELLQLLAASAAGSAPQGPARALTVEPVNGVLAACAAAGAAREAQQAFDILKQLGLEPDGDSWGGLVLARARGGQWLAAAQALEAAEEAATAAAGPAGGTTQDDAAAGAAHVAEGAPEGLRRRTRPGRDAYSAVIDGLFGTGLPWAQLQARHLYKSAIRGQLRVDLRGPDPGTALLSFHAWLAGTREAIGNSAAPSSLDECKRVLVVNGSDAGSPESGIAPAVKEAVGSALLAHRSPFRLTREAGVATRLESAAFMVKRWMFTGGYDSWEESFTGAAALRGTDLEAWLPALGPDAGPQQRRRAPPRVGGWEAGDAAAAAAAEAAWASVARYEARCWAVPDPQRGGEYEQRRGQLAEVALQLLTPHRLPNAAKVWMAALAVMDRVATAVAPIPSELLLATAAVLLASRQLAPAAGSEGGAPGLDAAVLAGQLQQAAAGDPAMLPAGLAGSDAGAVAAAIEAEVDELAAVLGGDGACVTAVDAWQAFATRLGCDVSTDEQAHAVLGNSFQRLLDLAPRPLTLRCPPSVVAVAAVCLARRQLGAVPFWPSVLRQLTGLDEDVHPQLAGALRELQATPHSSQFGSTTSAAVFA